MASVRRSPIQTVNLQLSEIDAKRIDFRVEQPNPSSSTPGEFQLVPGYLRPLPPELGNGTTFCWMNFFTGPVVFPFGISEEWTPEGSVVPDAVKKYNIDIQLDENTLLEMKIKEIEMVLVAAAKAHMKEWWPQDSYRNLWKSVQKMGPEHIETVLVSLIKEKPGYPNRLRVKCPRTRVDPKKPDVPQRFLCHFFDRDRQPLKAADLLSTKGHRRAFKGQALIRMASVFRQPSGTWGLVLRADQVQVLEMLETTQECVFPAAGLGVSSNSPINPDNEEIEEIH